jgi:hypothetical protein
VNGYGAQSLKSRRTDSASDLSKKEIRQNRATKWSRTMISQVSHHRTSYHCNKFSSRDLYFRVVGRS